MVEAVPTIKAVTLARIIVVEPTAAAEAAVIETSTPAEAVVGRTNTAAEAVVASETAVAARVGFVMAAAERAVRTEGIPLALSRTEDGEDIARSSDFRDSSIRPRPLTGLTRFVGFRRGRPAVVPSRLG